MYSSYTWYALDCSCVLVARSNSERSGGLPVCSFEDTFAPQFSSTCPVCVCGRGCVSEVCVRGSA